MESENIYQTMDAITNAICDSCEPRIRPEVTLQTVDDKTIIIVEVLPGSMRPYYIKSKGMMNGTYVRIAGTTRPVEDYMLKELILEGQNRYFESEPCKRITATAEEIQALCTSMKQVALKHTWQNSEKTNIKDITLNTLTSWGILREEHGNVMPTNAYALLNGKMPMRQHIAAIWNRDFQNLQGMRRIWFARNETYRFDGDFRVNMYRRIENEPAPDDRVNDKVNNKESEKAVLSLLMENPEYTVTQLADMLNVSRKTIANKMKVLKEI